LLDQHADVNKKYNGGMSSLCHMVVTHFDGDLNDGDLNDGYIKLLLLLTRGRK
jgi:hypothetical protein